MRIITLNPRWKGQKVVIYKTSNGETSQKSKEGEINIKEKGESEQPVSKSSLSIKLAETLNIKTDINYLTVEIDNFGKAKTAGEAETIEQQQQRQQILERVKSNFGAAGVLYYAFKLNESVKAQK